VRLRCKWCGVFLKTRGYIESELVNLNVNIADVSILLNKEGVTFDIEVDVQGDISCPNCGETIFTIDAFDIVRTTPETSKVSIL